MPAATRLLENESGSRAVLGLSMSRLTDPVVALLRRSGRTVLLFALDTVLELPHGADRAEFLDAIRGHVLASGELVGMFRR